MHIEKNVCESIYGTLLHQRGKTKDGVKAIKDLIELQIMGKLIPSENDKNPIPEHLTPWVKKRKKCSVKFCLKPKFQKGILPTSKVL